MNRFRPGFRALVIGGTGGIGSAMLDALRADLTCGIAVSLSRADGFDLMNEASIAAAASRLKDDHGTFDLVFVATGVLAPEGEGPERALKQIGQASMEQVIAINAIGPALLLKYFVPLLPRYAPSLMAFLSARVGSIGDNRLGGWISYRASKAALNQIVKTASIELGRTHKQAICVALHPGTVQTDLSAEFTRGEADAPALAASSLLSVLDQLTPAQSGGFFSYDGTGVPW